ncbi:MAG: hypothetical protein ACUVTB_07145 [Candidatus Bathycorpusculaceae bacterium]
MNGVVELSDDIVPLVDAFLHSDPFINAYAIWDLHYLRHRTKFFIYLDDGNLAGLLLDYLSDNGFHFIWLWGGEDDVEKLLNIPLPNNVFFCIFPEHENIIKRKFRITAKYLMDFMLLSKGEERLQLRHEVRKLNLNHAFSLASLIKEETCEEEVKRAESLLKERSFYGISVNTKLVSIACIWVKLPEIWTIGGFIQNRNIETKAMQLP